MNFGVNLNLQGNQLISAALHNLTGAPSSPVEGQIYYNTTLKRAFVWNGTKWEGADAKDAVLTGDNIIAAINGSAQLIDDDNLSAAMNAAKNQAHSHSNASILNATQESFTTALKTKLDNATEVTSENITATVAVGAINAGQTITAGKTLNEIVKAILQKIYYPTYTAPSLALTSSLSANIESGTTGDVTLTATFNRGSINGKDNSGTWEPATSQNPRAGVATKFTIAGIDKGTGNTHVLSAYQVVDGANTWSSNVLHAIGAQPVDSSGANFETPLPAGSINSNSLTVNGRRKAFYGCGVDTVVPNSSALVRGLTSNMLNPSNGSTFSISVPIGSKKVCFAYPATLQDVSTVKYVEGLNAEVKGIFTKTTVSVEGANSYTGINYKVYTVVFPDVTTGAITYTVTV